MTVYLLPVGRERFELYSEPPEGNEPPGPHAGKVRQWAHRAGMRWHALVETARRAKSAEGPAGASRFARWRDRVVCRLAETIAEQRTFWALGAVTRTTLLFPSTLSRAQARAILDRLLAAARWHHGLWLAIDAPIFVVSAVLAPIPGPNVVAYYLAFRLVGHVLAWRGAHQSMKRIAWTLDPHPKLAELESLLNVPRASRGARLDAIAEALELHRLAAFFDRVAA